MPQQHGHLKFQNMLGKQYYQSPMANKVIKKNRKVLKLKPLGQQIQNKLPSLTNQSTNLTTTNQTGTKDGRVDFSRGGELSSTHFNSLMSKELRSASLSDGDAKLPPETLYERSEASYMEEDDDNSPELEERDDSSDNESFNQRDDQSS